MGSKLTWTDVQELGEALEEAHPGVDPRTVRFTQLRDWVEGLPEFAPKPGQACNEAILEAIQAAWIGERGEEN